MLTGHRQWESWLIPECRHTHGLHPQAVRRWMCVCAHTRVHTHTHTHTRTQTCAHTRICTNRNTHAHTRKHIFYKPKGAHTHTHTFTRMHKHKHTYTDALSLAISFHNSYEIEREREGKRVRRSCRQQTPSYHIKHIQACKASGRLSLNPP